MPLLPWAVPPSLRSSWPKASMPFPRLAASSESMTRTTEKPCNIRSDRTSDISACVTPADTSRRWKVAEGMVGASRQQLSLVSRIVSRLSSVHHHEKQKTRDERRETSSLSGGRADHDVPS